MSARLTLFAVLLSCASAGPVAAQRGAAVHPSAGTAPDAHDTVTIVVEDPASLLDTAQLREDVARDLGIESTSDAYSATGPAIRIRVSATGEALIEFEFGPTRRVRTIELPADREEAARVVVLISTNLVREESADLLARLRAAQRTASVEETSPAVAPEPEPSAAPEEPAVERELDASEVETAAEEASSPWLRDVTEEYPGRFAFTHRGGAAPSDGQAAGFFIWGFEFGYAFDPMITIGITDLTAGGGYSSLEGVIFDGSGTVFGEVGGFVDPRIQPFGRIGVALQGRANPPAPASAFQLALMVGVGVRLFATRRMFFAFELDAHVVLTDAYAMGTAQTVDLPQGSTPASAGMTVGWQF